MALRHVERVVTFHSRPPGEDTLYVPRKLSVVGGKPSVRFLVVLREEQEVAARIPFRHLVDTLKVDPGKITTDVNAELSDEVRLNLKFDLPPVPLGIRLVDDVIDNSLLETTIVNTVMLNVVTVVFTLGTVRAVDYREK